MALMSHHLVSLKEREFTAKDFICSLTSPDDMIIEEQITGEGKQNNQSVYQIEAYDTTKIRTRRAEKGEPG